MSNLVTKSRLNYFATKLWNNKIKPIKSQLDSHTHNHNDLKGYGLILTDGTSRIELDSKAGMVASSKELYLRGGTSAIGIHLKGRDLTPDISSNGSIGTPTKRWNSINSDYFNAYGGYNIKYSGDCFYRINDQAIIGIFPGWDNSLYINCKYDPNTGGSNSSFTSIRYSGHFIPHSGNYDLGATYGRIGTVYSVNNINVSDRKLKDNITPLNQEASINEDVTFSLNNNNSYFDFIKKLPMYEYDYRLLRDGKYTNGVESHCIGFIAQDINNTDLGKKFIFETEDGDGNTTLSYNQNGYIGVLTLALQEAMKKIESLEDKINGGI